MVERRFFFKFRNVGKCSFREREAGSVAGGDETRFASSESSENGHLANGKPAVSLVAIKRFSRSETSENGHFAIGNSAVSLVAIKRLFRLLKSENGHFANGKA